MGPNYLDNGYRIIAIASQQTRTPNAGMAKGGVAVLIHEELEQYIIDIQRIGHRIMTIALQDQPKDIPVTIVATYAPHTRYSKKEKMTLGETRHTI